MKTHSELGGREYDGVDMMAGYWSEYIHKAAFSLLSEKCPPPARILDVGAGHGAFTKRLVDAGYEVVAIEGFADFCIDSVKCYKADINHNWPRDILGTFDVVVGIEIIEHIENPFHFARQAKKMLKRKGKKNILITTPNPLSAISRLTLFFGGKLELLEHEDHRLPIFPQTMEKICSECGLTMDEYRYDVDQLSISSTVKGYLFKNSLRFLGIFIKNKKYLKGVSNIWLLSG